MLEAGNPPPGGFGEGELRLCGVSQRWFLYPPDKTPHFHPNETTLAWLQRTYPTLPPAERPLECTLRPGEVRGRGEGRGGQLLVLGWKPPGAPTPLRSARRSCTSPTAGGTPRSTWTPASSSPPSWGSAGSTGPPPKKKNPHRYQDQAPAVFLLPLGVKFWCQCSSDDTKTVTKGWGQTAPPLPQPLAESFRNHASSSHLYC